jgi:hypothetical protein
MTLAPLPTEGRIATRRRRDYDGITTMRNSEECFGSFLKLKAE